MSCSPVRYSISYGPYQPLNKYPSSEAYRSVASLPLHINYSKEILGKVLFLSYLIPLPPLPLPNPSPPPFHASLAIPSFLLVLSVLELILQHCQPVMLLVRGFRKNTPCPWPFSGARRGTGEGAHVFRDPGGSVMNATPSYWGFPFSGLSYLCLVPLYYLFNASPRSVKPWKITR